MNCLVCGKELKTGEVDWCRECLRKSDADEMKQRHADERKGIQFEGWAE